jgi:tetratricopeptide (TPR) repeat protein
LNSRIIVFLLLILFCLPGCDTSQEGAVTEKAKAAQQEKPLPEIKPVTLLSDPIDVALVETATAALPIWRDYAAHKPALILFSNDPFLTPVPEPLHDQAMKLVRSGNPAQIKARAVDISPNPLLMHPMAVDAALKAGFFSELVWILPLNDEEPLPPLDALRQKMLDNGLLSKAEAKSFAAEGDHYTVVLRGIPVIIGTLAHIPLPKSPAWVHIDLSIFKPLYKNEVSTPLYPLVLDTLRKIRAAGISSVGVTISQSNLGGALSLKVRFLGKDLGHLLEHPASIDKDLPELQFRRTQNLYLEQFMKKEEILENCLKMEALAPEDPSVKFDLYHANREMQRGNQALEYLEKAVALDSMYAYEYFYLTETAVEKNRPAAALSMLEKARETFPGNPLTRIMEADINIRLGHREAALNLLDQLQSLPWSKVYDQDVPERLENMKKIAESLPVDH